MNSELISVPEQIGMASVHEDLSPYPHVSTFVEEKRCRVKKMELHDIQETPKTGSLSATDLMAHLESEAYNATLKDACVHPQHHCL